MAKNYAIIVGGGSGTRMQSNMPKQFMLLNGLPVLMHTISKFNNSQSNRSIVLVLNPHLKETWSSLCEQYNFSLPHLIVNGGDTRFHSVLNGLLYIKNIIGTTKDSYIAVHDGVRPLVTEKLIDRGFELVERSKALITAVTSKDSIRIKKEDNSNFAVNRENVYLVQTPQFFSVDLLLEAYGQPYQSTFTDDASVVESIGHPIEIIQGDTQNIKITFQEDLLLAENILRNQIRD